MRRPVLPYFVGLSASLKQQLQQKPVIWVQAVSVGETVVANCIARELLNQLPGYQLVFTTTTPTGQAMATKLLGDLAIVAYFPFDHPWLMKRFIDQIKPAVFVIVETEIWPNAIRYSKLSGAKVALVNGRISDRSFKRYLNFSSFLTQVFKNVDLFAMQSVEDANRIGELGAPLNLIMVTGNSKFDQKYPKISQEELAVFRKQYGWGGQTKIFTAASTHRGEETMIIQAYLTLLENEPYILILAPRHPDRSEEIEKLLKEANLPYFKRSNQQNSGKAMVLLLDTFGELGLAYAAADVVFVGGSLVKVGGHNVLEAAVQSKPVIYGPYMHNFRESKQLLETAEAGFTVHNPAELAGSIRHLTADPDRNRALGVKAREAVLKNQGASERTTRLIRDLLGGTT